MLIAAVLAVLALADVIEAWQLYALGFVQGIALALDAPARHTLVFRIVGRDDLPNAVGLSSGLGTTARIIGPALGGIVVATAGAGVAFAANAVSYAVVIGAITAMRITPRPTGAGAGSSVLSGVAETFRFAFGSRRVTIAFLAVLLVSTFSFNFDVLLPLLASRTLDEGAEVFGLIASVFGAGALCGALILATVGRARLLLVLGGAAGFGAFQLALAPQDSLAVVCALLFAIGVFYVLWGSSALATLQLAAPEHLRGRAASLYFFAFQGGAPLGGLIAGFLVAKGGTVLAFSFAGAVAVLVAVVGSVAAALARRKPGTGLSSAQEVPVADTHG
jgi:MFS family permease